MRFAALSSAMGSSALVLSLVGCGQDEELRPPDPIPPMEVGGLCSSLVSRCLDHSRVLVCQERVWTELECEAVCRETGDVTLGCRSEQFRGRCLCGSPDAGADARQEECASTLRRCIDSETLWTCDPISRVGREQSCANICAELSPPRRSAGCQQARGLFGSYGIDDCMCTLEGTACTGALAEICDGNRFVARCLGGQWQLDDCQLVCGPDRDAHCSSWAKDGGVGCVCDG